MTDAASFEMVDGLPTNALAYEGLLVDNYRDLLGVLDDVEAKKP